MTTARHLALLMTCTVLAVLSGATLQRRADAGARRDEGFTTIEWVVIALGLFLLATVAVGAITLAVDNRLGQIV